MKTIKYFKSGGCLFERLVADEESMIYHRSERMDDVSITTNVSLCVDGMEGPYVGYSKIKRSEESHAEDLNNRHVRIEILRDEFDAAMCKAIGLILEREKNKE